MNGVADMGGMHGFGPVVPSAEWKPFSADWERRILGVQFATLSAGLFPVDRIRAVTEGLPAAQYLSSSYFERWVAAVEQLLLEQGLVSLEELETGRAARPAQSCSVTAKVARMVIEKGGSGRAEGSRPPRFAPGDRVRARVIHPEGHTRLPRYVRGRVGEVVRDYGSFVFPDSNAAGKGPDPQHVYCVRFRARELWGPEAAPNDSLQIDMFDDYLEPTETPGPGQAQHRGPNPRGRCLPDRGTRRRSGCLYRFTSGASSPGRNGRQPFPKPSVLRPTGTMKPSRTGITGGLSRRCSGF